MSLRARFHRLFHFDICSSGIWFDYKGYINDEVLWLFPWKRKGTKIKYISMLCEGTFSSLEELDTFWMDYCDQERRETEEFYVEGSDIND